MVSVFMKMSITSPEKGVNIFDWGGRHLLTQLEYKVGLDDNYLYYRCPIDRRIERSNE